jgi:hypothetical protein
VGCTNSILLHMTHFRPRGGLVKPTAPSVRCGSPLQAKAEGRTRSGSQVASEWEGEAVDGCAELWPARLAVDTRILARAREKEETECAGGTSACVLHARPADQCVCRPAVIALSAKNPVCKRDR